jgi:hypothetical protein
MNPTAAPVEESLQADDGVEKLRAAIVGLALHCMPGSQCCGAFCISS